MTAGRGIVHSEDSVDGATGALHAAQLWIALPDAERHRAPAFAHYPSLPVVASDAFTVTVLAGTALGHTAPAQIFSPLVGLDLTCAGAAQTRLPLDPAFEHAVLVLSGTLEVAGEILGPGTLLYLGQAQREIALRSQAAARALVIGGEPFEERSCCGGTSSLARTRRWSRPPRTGTPAPDSAPSRGVPRRAWRRPTLPV